MPGSTPRGRAKVVEDPSSAGKPSVFSVSCGVRNSSEFWGDESRGGVLVSTS